MKYNRTTQNILDFLRFEGLEVSVSLLPHINCFKVVWISGEDFDQIINGRLRGIAQKQNDGSYLVSVWNYFPNQ